MSLKFNVNSFLLYSSIFLLGLWFAKFAIPYLLISFLWFYFLSTSKFLLTKPLLINYILLLLFITIYIIFWDDPIIPSTSSYFKDKQFFMLVELYVVLTSIVGITQFLKNKKQLLELINLFTLGMLLKSLSITLYTFVTAPYLLGLRQLLDPFSSQIVNSPAISLMAIFSALVGIYNLVSDKKSILLAIYSIVIILASLFVIILLQARTSFVILAFFLLFILLRRINFKIFLQISILITTLYLTNIYLLESNKFYKQTYTNTEKRFRNEGAESNRYKQWESAIEIITNNPIGGGSTNKSIENTNWFHNFWLDVGRTSGIFPLILILIYQSHILYKLGKSIYYNSNSEKKYLLLTYISVLIGMSVEIPLEGNIVMFLFHVFLGTVILKYLQLEKYESNKKVDLNNAIS